MSDAKSNLLKQNQDLILKARIRALVLDDYSKGIFYKSYVEIARALGESETKVTKACRMMPFFKGAGNINGQFIRNILMLGTYPPSAADLVMEAEREIVRATVASLLIAHALEVFSHGDVVHLRVEEGAGELIATWIDTLLAHGHTLNTLHDRKSIVIFCADEKTAETLANELVGYVPDSGI